MGPFQAVEKIGTLANFYVTFLAKLSKIEQSPNFSQLLERPLKSLDSFVSFFFINDIDGQ